MQSPSLFVAIASGRDARWPFPIALANMMVHLAQTMPNNSRLTLMFNGQFDTAQARRFLVSGAKKWNASHILFLDDDMDFPPDAATILMSHGKEIIAANYTNKFFPVIPLAQKNGKRVMSRGRAGLEQVDFAPTGVMLIDMSVFERIEKPYFEAPCDNVDTDEGVSDDVYFCRKAAAVGIPTLIDHDLSQRVRHVGTLGFDHRSCQEPESNDLLQLCQEVLK